MIFITLGSQKFQFNRLLMMIDDLIYEGIITDDVFAQIGFCDYHPKNFKFEKYLDRDTFAQKMKECDFVITHAGTGAIVTALKNNKKVIAVPRLSKHNEHVDNHQEQIVSQFEQMNFLYSAHDYLSLRDAVNKIENSQFSTYISSTEKIINSIEEFIIL